MVHKEAENRMVYSHINISDFLNYPDSPKYIAFKICLKFPFSDLVRLSRSLKFHTEACFLVFKGHVTKHDDFLLSRLSLHSESLWLEILQNRPDFMRLTQKLADQARITSKTRNCQRKNRESLILKFWNLQRNLLFQVFLVKNVA